MIGHALIFVKPNGFQVPIKLDERHTTEQRRCRRSLNHLALGRRAALYHSHISIHYNTF
jgi:hypothetical protein